VILVVFHPGGDGRDLHEAPWVDVVFPQTGQLVINLYDEQLQLIGWQKYADGAWASVKLQQPPTPEMRQAKHAQEQRPGTTPPMAFPNGGTW
jgi:hypothetical protein